MADPRDLATPGEEPSTPAVPYGSGPASTIPTEPVAAAWVSSEPGPQTARSPIVSWEPSGGAAARTATSGTTSAPGAIAGWAAPSDAAIGGRPAPVPIDRKALP